MNIALIGYRGTGKSTIGKHLAATLHMDFVDADLLLVQRAGKTIKEIFETEGEPAFRDRESTIIRELATRKETLIAAGGGAVLREENRTALRNAAVVVWLQADPETLHARIAADQATASTRPNLTASGGIAEVQTLLATRTPLYQATSHLTLDVSTLSIEAAATEITRLLHEHTSHYGTRPYNPQNP
jgi:shikimate kinase